MTVLVPFSNAANIGLRRVTKDREISRILSYLSNGLCDDQSGLESPLQREHGKMQSGDLLMAAEVFKVLLQLHVDKPLSFREKKMLDRARHMLVSEISISRNVPDSRGRHAAALAGQSRVDLAGGVLVPVPAK